jgi:hypothetical protein
VVAERRVERDVGVEQRACKAFELLGEVLRALGAVEVFAKHDGEVIREHRVRFHICSADVDLRAIAVRCRQSREFTES